MAGPVAGKLALITGAGSGIGRAVCEILFRDGARIIAVDQNPASACETIKCMGEDHLALKMDVSSQQSISAAIAEIQKKYAQPPTIIVNSAGITRDSFLLKMSEENFDAVINVNLKGTFLVMQNFAKAMIEHVGPTGGPVPNGGGSIINLASIVGKTGNMGQANYSSSKAGVVAMTRVASKEFGKFGIRVNCVLPGFIRSPMTEVIPEKLKEMVKGQCALKRFGEPSEIAEVIAFLASNRSSFVNGADIDVTGG